MENKSLILDLVEWIAQQPRPYDQVMEAWRTSCPRLSVWEDSLDLGLVARTSTAAGDTLVTVTPAGRSLLLAEGRQPTARRAS